MSSNQGPVRLSNVIGYEERHNDIVYVSPYSPIEHGGMTIFFPGDVQDYVENMEAHRDNKHYKDWNLESTASILQEKFPQNHILVVKPSRMDLKTFSSFQNFVKCSNLGVPEHCPNYNSLIHLNNIIKNVSERQQILNENEIAIIGFSKGCVVLNQFLHEFNYYQRPENCNEIVLNLIKRIRHMFWLDGGHSGGQNTWVCDKEILKTLCSLSISIHVHVTPYQIEDERRPWIRKEEKAFSDYLTHNGGKIVRQIHFETIPSTILTHFDVINAFC